MKLVIVRSNDNGTQTIGRGIIFDNLGRCIYEFYTLELSWKNNKKRISCIPPDNYKLFKRTSLKFKKHLHVQNVENRSFILVHAGNYYTDILGCILVGDALTYLNKDGLLDVLNSRLTLDKILSLLDTSNDLQIVDFTKF